VFATAVANPCYRVHAEIRGPRTGGGKNPRHHLQDLFQRRLRQGRCHRTPCLGLSEFTCDYWGPERPEWEIDDALTAEIPSMLWRVWDQPQGGSYVSRFGQRFNIERGILTYKELAP